MESKGISITFIYNGIKKGPFIHNPNEKIKDICKEFTKKNNMDFNSLFFVLDGTGLTEQNFDNPINKFVSSIDKEILNILIYDNYLEYTQSIRPLTSVNNMQHNTINNGNNINKNLITDNTNDKNDSSNDINVNHPVNKYKKVNNSPVIEPTLDNSNIHKNSNFKNADIHQGNPNIGDNKYINSKNNSKDNSNNPNNINDQSNIIKNNNNINDALNNKADNLTNDSLMDNINFIINLSNNDNLKKNQIKNVNIPKIPELNIPTKFNTSENINDVTNIISQTERDLITVHFFFEFNHETSEILFPSDKKIEEICKIFSNKKGLNIHSLDFFNKNQKLNVKKTFEDIADANDKNERKLKIQVKENNEESCFK